MTNDWRLFNQENYLKDKQLKHKAYKPRLFDGEHVHCVFCWLKIEENDEAFNYETKDEDYWICEKCFNDFKETFNWGVVEKE
jgi:hypothetical protein